jgi:hypothetical protein
LFLLRKMFCRAQVALGAFHNTKLDDAENAALEKLRVHPSFVALKKQKDEEFSAGTAIGQRAAL